MRRLEFAVYRWWQDRMARNACLCSGPLSRVCGWIDDLMTHRGWW